MGNRATEDDIRRWFEDGAKQNATHLIVVCDTFSMDDYPEHVLPGQDAQAIVKRLASASMSKVMEVYHHALPLEPQIAEDCAYHLTAEATFQPPPGRQVSPALMQARLAWDDWTEEDRATEREAWKGLLPWIPEESIDAVITEVARALQPGATPASRAWAVQALHAAGNPTDPAERARTLLAAVRTQVGWVPDPVQTWVERHGERIREEMHAQIAAYAAAETDFVEQHACHVSLKLSAKQCREELRASPTEQGPTYEKAPRYREFLFSLLHDALAWTLPRPLPREASEALTRAVSIATEPRLAESDLWVVREILQEAGFAVLPPSTPVPSAAPRLVQRTTDEDLLRVDLLTEARKVAAILGAFPLEDPSGSGPTDPDVLWDHRITLRNDEARTLRRFSDAALLQSSRRFLSEDQVSPLVSSRPLLVWGLAGRDGPGPITVDIEILGEGTGHRLIGTPRRVVDTVGRIHLMPYGLLLLPEVLWHIAPGDAHVFGGPVTPKEAAAWLARWGVEVYGPEITARTLRKLGGTA